MQIKAIHTILFLSVFISSGFAQNPQEFFSMMKAEYPDERMVLFDNKQHFIFKTGKNDLEVYLKENKKIIFLKNPSGMDPTQSLYTSVMNELIDFEVNSYIPAGKKYKKIAIEDYKEKSNVEQYSFYDDIKELSFTFPGVGEGTILELNSIHRINEPRLLPTTYLTSYVPLRNMEIIYESDEGIDYELLFLNKADGLCKFEVSESRGKKIKRCTLKNIEAIKIEDHQPDITYFEPHIIAKIKRYQLNKTEHPYMGDLDALYSWYYSLVEDIVIQEPDAVIRTKANEITKNCSTEYEEVRQIYYWVQSNIKYVAFEYGLGGYIPRNPVKTLKNRYGDCKDKTVLLYALLKSRGIDSHITWIGTRDLPYLYSEVPTPNTDNHMIITYQTANRTYFLDGTNNFHPIDLTSQFIQNKEALISKGKDQYEIKKVPAAPPEVSHSMDSVHLHISGKSIIGNGNVYLTGYHKTNMYHLLSNRTDKVRTKIIEHNLMKGNNKFVLEEYTISEIESFDPGLEIDYQFSLQNLIQEIDHEMYLNLNLDRGWMDYRTKKDRENPLLLPYNTKTTNRYYLAIPEGYEIVYLPENISYQTEHFSLNITYSREKDYLIYEHIAHAELMIVEKSDFPEWNSFINELEKAYKHTILLKRNE